MNGFASRKLISLAVAGALGASVLTGAVAYASSSIPGGLSLTTIAGGIGGVVDHGRGQDLAAILKGLVDKGVITQAQADAVVAAVQAAHPAPPAGAFGGHGLFGDLNGAATTYLGLTREAIIEGVRAGKSLAEIAAATPGKSRDGLIAALTQAANAAIDKAQADGKITAEQATAAKSRVGENVASFVDRKGGPGLRPGPGARPGGPRGPMPFGPRPSASLTA